MSRLGLREAQIDALSDEEWAAASAAALWLEEREVELQAAALARVLGG